MVISNTSSSGSYTYQALQGSIFSAIGRGINAIISAIASVIMTIVGVITSSEYQLIFSPWWRQY